MKELLLRTSCAFMWALGGAVSAEAALEARLETSPGSGVFLAYYDTDQDITWATNSSISGLMNWAEANAWAAGVSIGGIGGWRLPDMDRNGDTTVVSLSTCASNQATCLDNEFAYHLVFNGVSTTSPGPFSNITTVDYWSSTFSGAGLAWEFNFGGAQGIDNAVVQMESAWAVRDGDVPALTSTSVPGLSPGGLALLGGLLVIAVVRGLPRPRGRSDE